jgi:hypothetical protein
MMFGCFLSFTSVNHYQIVKSCRNVFVFVVEAMMFGLIDGVQLKQLVHLESIETELKRRHAIEDEAKRTTSKKKVRARFPFPSFFGAASECRCFPT